MSELRTRMIRDMTVRGFSPRTHQAYIGAVVGLAKYYGRSPDQISNDEVEAYLAHLIQERKRSWSTCSQAAHAFRFLSHVTLGYPRTDFHVPAPKQPQKLPEILSRAEVWRLLAACPHPRHRLLLATTYAAGLRVSEVVALKVSDIDAERLTVRVEQGKGGKDRSVPLATRLLHELRAYWKTAPPGVWLFANRQGTRPTDITVAQKIYTMAKLRAGIHKQGGIHALRHAFGHPPAGSGHGPAHGPAPARAPPPLDHDALLPPEPGAPRGNALAPGSARATWGLARGRPAARRGGGWRPRAAR